MTPIHGGVITTPFSEPRPLSVPPAQRTHVHGALDVAGGDGIVRAPADGTAQGFAIYRGVDPDRGRGGWGGKGIVEKSEILAFPWREYWYDTFGAFVTLIEPSGRLHLLCHIWPSRMLNPQPGPARYPFRYAYYIEEEEATRWPCHLMMTEATQVRAGQPIAPVGYAGYVTGPTGRHVHWEIHHQADRLDDYAARIDPAKEYMR